MFESIHGLPATPRERAGLMWGMVRAGCLSAFGGLALAYVVVAVCSGDDAPAPRVASPPPETPKPPAPEPPKDPIAAVDEQADRARAEKDEGAALDAYIVARKLLISADFGGAPDKDVKPRMAALDREIARLDCKVMGAMRAGVVRDAAIDAMARSWMSGNVRVSGKCNTTITFEWAGFSDVTVSTFGESVAPMLTGRGFTTIRYKGWDSTWTQTFD
jgi:hypothetical protein